jgi:hypothetical protein
VRSLRTRVVKQCRPAAGYFISGLKPAGNFCDYFAQDASARPSGTPGLSRAVTGGAALKELKPEAPLGQISSSRPLSRTAHASPRCNERKTVSSGPRPAPGSPRTPGTASRSRSPGLAAIPATSRSSVEHRRAPTGPFRASISQSATCHPPWRSPLRLVRFAADAFFGRPVAR